MFDYKMKYPGCVISYVILICQSKASKRKYKKYYLITLGILPRLTAYKLEDRQRVKFNQMFCLSYLLYTREGPIVKFKA